MGWASRLPLPRPLRDPIYRGFARHYGIDLSELDRPLADFDRFDDFFCRPLPEGAREIAAGPDILVSPADGLLSGAGLADDGLCIHAKGQEYTVSGLLQDEAAARAFVGGQFLTIYLAPYNYHRVHTPIAAAVQGYRHIPGARYPVNALSVRTVPQLFMRNERLVTYLDTAVGQVALVMVAASGVGNITVSYEPTLTTLAGGPDRGAHRYEQSRPLGKGDELGMFHLGSTVILLFQPGSVQIDLPTGTPVRVGQRIGRKNPQHQGQ
jgi:phosphatidylserine decarboxylase